MKMLFVILNLKKIGWSLLDLNQKPMWLMQGHKKITVLSASSRVGEVKKRIKHPRNKRPISRVKFL